MAYFPEQYGKTVIPAMIDILDGKAYGRRAPPRSCSRQHVVINKDNIRDDLSGHAGLLTVTAASRNGVGERMTFELQARQIRKSFGGVEVLHGVDLDAVGGSVLALLGENGAGKSTLVKIIAGDYQADAGEIEVDGVGYPCSRRARHATWAWPSSSRSSRTRRR